MFDWAWGTAKRPPADPCDGCHACGLRCTAGVQMTRGEFQRIVDHLRRSDPAEARRILDQDKEVQWFEDISVQACLFYDVRRKGCLVYPARPLICRLFGLVEWLPCPIGKVETRLHDGLQIIQDYARERRQTFEQWLTEEQIFDPLDLVAEERRGGERNAD